MARYPSDTHPKIAEMQLHMLSQVPVQRKLAMVGDMNNAVLSLAMIGLKRRHPHDREAELRRRLSDLVLGPKLAAKVYGPANHED